MDETDPDKMLPAGEITGPYGIQGWVKIHSYTEPQDNLLRFNRWWLQRRGVMEPVALDAGRRHGKGLVAHIAGVDDRTRAEAYRGLQILVQAAQLPELAEGDYYWHQLQGLQVWCSEDSERVLLGTVDHLIETGANDVLVVKPSEGSVDDRERLIPYLPGEVVNRVDLEAAVIEVTWYIDE
jgi:16S rRNA processing protein RimM